MDYSIIVPVFNSEDTLKELFERIQRVFEGISSTWEVIFIEDCGIDGSWSILETLKKEHPERITAIKLTKNYGQHNATFCGLIHAKGNRVITIDDDLQTPPEEIIKLIELQDQQNADLVYGLYPVKRHSLMRNLWSSSLKITSKAFFDGPGKGSSFRLITGELVKKVLAHHQNFIYLDELFNWYTTSIEGVNVKHEKRKSKRSGYNSFQLIGLFANIMIYYSSVPLRMMIYTGFVVSFFTFLVGLFYIIKRLFFNVSVPGYTSLIVAILFSTGIILLSLGVIGEYLSRIYMVQNKKPPFSIKKII